MIKRKIKRRVKYLIWKIKYWYYCRFTGTGGYHRGDNYERALGYFLARRALVRVSSEEEYLAAYREILGENYENYEGGKKKKKAARPLARGEIRANRKIEKAGYRWAKRYLKAHRYLDALNEKKACLINHSGIILPGEI